MWLLLAGCSVPPPARPNVLLITLDTMRRDAVGAYGATTGATPNLDTLASEGVRFDRAYTVTPLTIPAHSSMFTGMYPPRHGVRDNGDFFLGDDAMTLAERLSAAGYRTMASVGAEVTSRHWGFAQGFSAYFDDMGARDPEGNRWRVERGGDLVVDDALGWLDASAKPDASGNAAPWFAWVHLFDVHHPYEPPSPFDAMFADAPYAGEVAFVDAQVRRLREWLETNDQLRNTWIFVVADHGEGLGSHGEALHGVLLYDATTKIPFLVRPPAGTPRTVDAPVSLVDLLPTILGVTGVAPATGIDGVDLRPFMEGNAPADRAVYVESRYAWHHYGWAPQTALVTPEHKLIDSTTPELYAATDRWERANLAKTMPSLFARTMERLDALVASLTPADAAVRVDLSPEKVAQLEALGYLTTSGGGAGEPTDNLPDPVKQLPVLRMLEQARARLQAEDIPGAEAAIAAALAADPALVEARVLQAQLALRAGRQEDGVRLLEALDAERPSSRTKGMLGSVRLGQADYQGALRLFEAGLALDPYLPSMWVSYLHALLFTQDGRLLAEATRGDALIPGTPGIIGMKGVALAMQGRFALARPLLEQALEADPTQPFANHALGLVHKERGDLLAAEPFFEEEVRLFSPATPSRRALVEIYAGQKRYDEQLAQLEVIVKTESASVDTFHSLAQALFNLQRYTDAMAVIGDCRALDPGYAPCALLEANALAKLGRRAEAEAVFEQAKKLRKTPRPRTERAGAGER